MARSGVFLPTTNIWDIENIQKIDVQSDDFKELFVRLYQNINNICLAVNAKESAYYLPEEFATAQQFFPNPLTKSLYNQVAPAYRPGLRKLVVCGTLPNTGLNITPHNIICNSRTTFTRIYGCSSDTSGKHYIPLPFASPILANNISLEVDDTNVIITTGSDRTAFTITYVIVEYLQQ